MLEVEIKASIDKQTVEKELALLGAGYLQTERHVDTYFKHPCVDFKSRDEALRVRRVGEKLLLTFKGPKLDSDTKTRVELEVEVQGEIYDLLRVLGFRVRSQVMKERRMYRYQNLKICVDTVESLGDFLEIEAENRNEKGRIFDLLERIGISADCLTRKSYLELILEKQGKGKNE